MPEDRSAALPDEQKSRAQLLQEMSELRTRLAAEEQKSRTLHPSLQRHPPASRLSDRQEEHSPALFDALREAFVLYEAVLDEAGDPVDLRYLQVNRAFCAVMRQPPETFIGHTIREVYPDIDAFWAEQLGQVALSGTPLRFERQGSLTGRWGEIHAFCPQPGQVATLSYDISERKAAEAKLRESETLFRAVQDNSPDRFTILKPFTNDQGEIVDFTYVYQNARSSQLTGRRPEDTVGRRLAEIYPTFPQTRFFTMYRQVAETGQPLEFEERYDSDGVDEWFRATVTPIPDGIAITTQIITESKRRERNAAFLAEMGRDFARPSTAGEIMQTVGEEIGAYLNVSNCLFADIDENADTSTILYSWRRSPDIPDVIGVHKHSAYVSEEFRRAAHAGETIVIRNTQTDPRTDAAGYARFSIHASMSVPVFREGEWKHLFTVNDSVARDWRADEIELIEEFTRRVFLRLERAQAEEALRESEALYRAIAQNFPDGAIYVFDHDLRFRVADGQAMAVLGFSREGLEDKTIWEATDAETCRILEARYPRVLAGESMHFETTLKGRVFSSDYVPIRDEAGKVIAGMVVSHDITERIQGEEALRRAKEQTELDRRRLETILETIPSALVIVEASDGRFSYLNRRALDLYGIDYTGFDLAAHLANVKALKTDGTPFRLEEMPVSQALQRGEVVRDMEMIIQRADGLHIPVVVGAAPLWDGEGNVHSAIVTFEDISRRKEAEMALQSLNATLEQQVAERAAVAEKRASQLQALTLQLTEAEEREHRRIADLLHDDLQQLLSATRFHLSVVRPAVAEQSTAALMLQQADQLLDQSIAKSRRLSQDLSPAILFHSGLPAAVQWLAKQMQERHGLTVQVESSDVRLIQNDLLQVFLYRSIQELLFNVVKHASVDRAQVRLEKREDRLEVTVSDPGQGFDPQSLHYPDPPTSGFGVFSIRERIACLGGSLDIESAPGEGSRFRLTIPLGLDQPKRLLPLHSAPEVLSRTLRSKEKTDVRYRILLVDDHQVMRQGLIAVLDSQPDFQVIGEAANGREAVDLARSLSPDVILMDIVMSEMDGIEATRLIKEEMPEVRVIGLSMLGDDDVSEQLKAAGAQSYINKGKAAETLVEAIRQKPVS